MCKSGRSLCRAYKPQVKYFQPIPCFRGKSKFELKMRRGGARSVPELPCAAHTMALRSAPTARGVAPRTALDAQENQDPEHVGISAKSLVSASGPPSKARNSVSSDSSTRKHRRALQSIDSNCPRPTVNAPKRAQPNASARDLQSPVDAKKSLGQATVALHTSTGPEGQETGRTGAATTPVDEAQSPHSSSEQTEAQESENLA